MKIVTVHNRYRSSSPSGEDRVVDQEHDVLVDAGHEVRRFERRSDEIGALSPRDKVLIPSRFVWNPDSAQELQEVLAKDRPDVVHVHNLFPLLSPSILEACRRNRVPCVVTLHNFHTICASGMLFRDGSVCHDCVGRRVPVPGVVHGCYRGSRAATVPRTIAIMAHRKRWQTVPSAYIFLSDAQRRELEPAGFPLSRSFVKPNLVPPVKQRTSPEELIVFLGRLTPDKGLRVLMQAWERYESTAAAPRLRLAIAGTGPMEGEVAAWADSRRSVESLGLLDRPACAELVARAAAVVVPSEWPEPFGLVVVEALAAGVPPVATAHGAFPDLITHDRDGILYPPGDAEALGGILARIEQDPGWVDRLGRAARHRYEQSFSPERNLTELERVYQFAIDNPRWCGDPR